MFDPLETRPIPGINNYLARADGQIVCKRTGKLVHQRIREDGYAHVNIYANRNTQTRKVCQLVTRAFYGARPAGGWVTFRDNDRLNCNASNLCWMKGRHLMHLGRYGEQATGAKLTEAQVIEILDLIAAGRTQVSVAAQFDVSGMAINRIVLGRAWPHIPRPDALKHIKVRPVYEPVEPVAA